MNRASTPRFSPVWLVLIGILSVQFGAVISKGLFGQIPPVGMVFLRLITSSLILLALARPRLRGRPAADWWPVLALGFALGAMNWAFYESFARIPLGVAVTIEFVGPLSLAAVGSRRPRDLVWVGLAALGITLFGAGPTKVDAVGFGLALVAGGCWALYIVSTAATGRRWAGVEGLAVASTVPPGRVTRTSSANAAPGSVRWDSTMAATARSTVRSPSARCRMSAANAGAVPAATMAGDRSLLTVRAPRRRNARATVPVPAPASSANTPDRSPGSSRAAASASNP